MVEIISPLRDLGRGGAGGQEGALFALEDVLRNGAWAVHCCARRRNRVVARSRLRNLDTG
jgi:hypothetical protein